jgi:hypothetical protein
MLTKDILKTPLTTELVVANPHSYVHRSDKNAENLPQSKALVGVLAGYDTYADTNWTDSTPDSPRFVKTTAEKTKRFLFKFQDNTGQDVYRVISAVDVIAPKSEMNVRWAEASQREAEKNAQRQKIAEAEQAMEAKRKAEEQSIQHAVASNLVELFGNNWEQLGIDMNWIRVTIETNLDDQGNAISKLKRSGRIDIPVDHFLRMVQRFADQ